MNKHEHVHLLTRLLTQQVVLEAWWRCHNTTQVHCKSMPVQFLRKKFFYRYFFFVCSLKNFGSSKRYILKYKHFTLTKTVLCPRLMWWNTLNKCSKTFVEKISKHKVRNCNWGEIKCTRQNYRLPLQHPFTKLNISFTLKQWTNGSSFLLW